ncbi:MAG: sugar transferase, partial [Solobacterium sp.]|nr:sugar transferase [Solobacterium sp.]
MSTLKRYTLYVMNAADLIADTLAFLLAFWLRNQLLPEGMIPLQFNVYLQFLLITFVAYFVINLVYLYKDDGFLQRTAFRELAESLKISLSVTVAVLIIINFLKQNSLYSRMFEMIYFGLFLMLDYGGRISVKSWLTHRYLNTSFEKMIVITRSQYAERIVSEIRDRIDWRYSLSGMILLDNEQVPDDLNLRVIAGRENMYSRLEDTDYGSVLIVPNGVPEEELQDMVRWFQAHGKTVHIHIQEYEYSNATKTLDRIGSSAVVTYRMYTPISRRQAMFKTLCDVLLSLVLLPLLLVLVLVVMLFTITEGPGSILVRRIRIGRNNRRFYQYRFRVYRLDAEQRMQEGKSPYTLIGRFLRFTHLDGLPMIFNVLFGEMSIVGSKAPNLMKYLEMTPEQRNLLLQRPGIIGLWSCLKNPEDIQAEEENYIQKWSFLKDCMIFLMAALRYVTGRSLRYDGEVHIQEELDNCRMVLEQRRPIPYEHNWEEKPRPFYAFIKRLFDILVSLAALIVLCIPMVLIAVLIVLNDGGRPLYGHIRTGKNGRRI